MLVVGFFPEKTSFFFLFYLFCTKNIEKQILTSIWSVQQNIEKADFDQHLKCAAPKSWSKYTTFGSLNMNEDIKKKEIVFWWVGVS